jgi:tetratricopeptide (TPR) repeat protein
VTVTTWTRGLCALALTLAIGLPARAEDKWYELYQGALKSISSRKWTDAEKKLRAAMASGPTPGRQVRMYGVRFIDYLPEYHLGLVYFNQQRYADALEQFAKAQASGQVTKGDVEFATMTDMVELCRIRTAGTRPDGQKESEALVRFARELMGRGSLEDARRALDTAAAKTPGAPEVASAREELVRLETEKRMRAAQDAASDLPKPPARTSPAPEPAPPSPGPSPRAPSPTPSAKAFPEPAANALAARERGAFQAFYSGDYATAAERFEALAEKGRRPQRERFVAYAAFSRAGAALLRGRDGEGDLLRARRLYAEAGATGSRAIASDGFLPPGIVRAITERTPR